MMTANRKKNMEQKFPGLQYMIDIGRGQPLKAACKIQGEKKKNIMKNFVLKLVV